MVRLATALIALTAIGCSKAPTSADLVGEWEGKMTEKELGTFTVMTLKLTGDGRFESDSFAGTMYGDWSLSGKTLTLKMTGLDDGYGKVNKDDPQWRSSTRPMTLNVRSKKEMELKVPEGASGKNEKLTFTRR